MKKGDILNKILILSIFLFIFSSGFLIYSLFFKPTPVKGLKINLIGANEVNSLENYNYQVEIINNSNQRLTDTNLKISLSNGAFFVDRNEKEFSLFMDELEPKKSYKQNFELFFLNEGGLRENIKITLSYRIENKSYVFEKEENFSVFVKNPPIKVQIYLPEKVYVNQQFQASFRILNLTNRKLNNLKISIEPPSSFILSSAFPQSENFYWQFPTINPLETKDISLVGQIQNIQSSGIFGVKVNFDFQNSTYSLVKEIAKINLLENPVSFEIKTTPIAESIPIGSNIYYEITLENKSQTLLENNEVRVYFDGPFDFSSLNTDGYFSQLDNILYFNARNKPELLKLNPGDKVKFNFSISLYQSYPILGEKNKNFSAKIKVEFRSPTIPTEVETAGKEYVVFQENEKKIIGNIYASQEVVYNDKYFPGTGPLPLQANQATTLAWHIKIKTIGEDFENFNLNTKLPAGVNLTGKVGGDAILDNLKFDPKTGLFIYSLNNLPANLGYLEKEIDLVFQIIVVPPANIDLSNFMIIPQVQYTAKGIFSKTQINNNLRAITSGEIK